MKNKRLNIRVDENFLIELDRIAKIESKITGMKISQSNIIRQAIFEYIKKKENNNV